VRRMRSSLGQKAALSSRSGFPPGEPTAATAVWSAVQIWGAPLKTGVQVASLASQGRQGHAGHSRSTSSHDAGLECSLADWRASAAGLGRPMRRNNASTRSTNLSLWACISGVSSV